MVVADECRLQSEPNPFYRWSKKGKKSKVKIRQEKKSVSFYGGLSLKMGKVVGHQTEWQNSEETILFLEEINREYREKGTILLIWDNASWHKSKQIRTWLKRNPRVVELMNFPPYSPDLNPQEHVWKEMKRYLAEYFEGEKFERIIDKACLFLTTRLFDYKLF